MGTLNVRVISTLIAALVALGLSAGCLRYTQETELSTDEQTSGVEPQSECEEGATRCRGAERESCEGGAWRSLPCPTTLVCRAQTGEGLCVDEGGGGAGGEPIALPPVVEPLVDQILTTEVEWTLQVVAYDPNGDDLTYSLGEGAPEGLLLSPEGLLLWTPTSAQVGEHPLEVKVSDGALEVSASARLVVQLSGATSNAPPVFYEPTLEPLTVGELFSYTFTAQDDGDGALTYAVEGAPEGASFNTQTGRFEWTPTSDFANNTVRIRVSASDGELTSYLQVSLSVRLAQRACDQPPEAVVETFPIALGAEIVGRLLCNEQDADRFELTLRQRALLKIDVIFTHALGDVDIRLLDDADETLYTSLSVTDNESIETNYMNPGRYTIEVKLFRDGPVTYNLTLNELAGDPSCDPDRLEGTPYNDDYAHAAPISTETRYDALSLCRGDVDVYTFSASRGQPITVTLDPSTTEVVNMRLISPTALISSDGGKRWFYSNNSFTHVAPESGEYGLEIGYNKVLPSFTYNFSVSLSAVLACEADRLETGDRYEHASSLSADLYLNLTSCADPNDWYRTRPSNGGVQVFVGYDSPATAPTMTAVDSTGAPLPGSSFGLVNISTTGCVSNRTRCYRALLPTPPNGGDVYYSVRFDEIGTTYDLRVRSGL